MKKIMLFTTIIVVLLLIAMVAAKNEGLHPNFKGMLYIIPGMYLLAWSRCTAAVSSNEIKSLINK